MKYKIGDILKVKKGCEDKCFEFRRYSGKFIKILDINEGVYYNYDILDKDFNRLEWCHTCFKDEHLEPLEKTWETLQEGDVVIDGDGFDREILGICGKLYFLSDWDANSLDTTLTIQEMKDYGYTIKDAKPEVCKACGNEIKK